MLTTALRGLYQSVAIRVMPFRRVERGTDTLVLRYRSLYILPTREGVYYGVMLFVMLLAAINYSNGLAYALTFILSGIGVVAILHTHRNVVGLRFSAGSIPPVFVGEPAVFNIVVHNDTDTPRRAIDITMESDMERFDVPPRGTTTVSLCVPSNHRGYLAAPPMKLNTRFPLGLWRAWSRPLALSMHCLVYPRPTTGRPLPEAPPLPNEHERGQPVEGEDFAGLREYRHGDSMQRIAWKKIAAGHDWHTKQFSAPAAQFVWLEWDALSGFDVEQRLSLLCGWVLTAEQRGLAYGLRLPDITLPPATGLAHRNRCLERLALYEPPSS